MKPKPRGIARLIQCAAIRPTGARCHAYTKLKLMSYYGDPEFYPFGPEPRLVAIYLCPKHRKLEES